MSSRPRGRSARTAGTFATKVLAELRTVGGDELVGELMALFAERSPARLHEAEECLAAGDLDAAAAALHSLRSAAGTIGAGRLVEMSGQLERAARGGRAAELQAGLAELRRQVDEVLSAARRLTG